MYKLMVKDSVFTILKESIIMFALHKALENGITHGKIHDSETAIEYLESIGIRVVEDKENGKTIRTNI